MRVDARMEAEDKLGVMAVIQVRDRYGSGGVEKYWIWFIF